MPGRTEVGEHNLAGMFQGKEKLFGKQNIFGMGLSVVPHQRITILKLGNNIAGIDIHKFVGDVILPAIRDPVRVKTVFLVVNGYYFFSHQKSNDSSLYNLSPLE